MSLEKILALKNSSQLENMASQIEAFEAVDAGAEVISARDGADLLATNLDLKNDIRGTSQFYTFNSDGTVLKIQHKDSGNAVIREDVFTYATNLITEVRTLTSGGTLTFINHLDTLETEVI